VIGNVVARRYAKALVDILTEREGDFDAVHAEIEGLASIVEGSRDLTRLLYSPSIRLEVKRGIVEDLIARTGLSEISSTFVRLLLEKGRLRYLTSIAETFEYLANERRGRLKVNLTSSAPLGDDVVERLKAEIEILIETAVDPALIGGLVVRIGDRVLDGSIKHQLAAMRESLVRG
jgi:F-type H+-transporting ATPase subunit delta